MASSPDPAVVHGPGEAGEIRPRVCDNCIRQKVKCMIPPGLATIRACANLKGPLPATLQVIWGNRNVQGVWNVDFHAPIPQIAASLDQPQDLSVDLSQAPPRRLGRDDEWHTVRPTSGFHVDFPSPESSIHVPSTGSASVTLDVVTGSTTQPVSTTLNIAPEEEELLLNCYFDTVHHAIPLFLDPRVPSGGGTAREAVAGCSLDLLHTLVVITAKLSGFVFSSMNESELNTLIDRMLSSASLQEDIAGDTPTLDQFRRSCLLVFYEYHQCPGHQAWMRIGKLVRWAYWAGLDQIDKRQQLSPRWKTLSEDELEEWRLVWWCVYCLDSYANVSTGMPYEIDEQLINTALPRGPSTNAARRVCLPYRQDGLLALVQNSLSESPPQTAALEIQLVSITILRHVGRALRLHALGTYGDHITVVADTERRLSALRLALPGNFFNPRRNAFSNESAFAHHFRLVTINHMLMAQMLIVLSHCGRLGDGEAWLQNWQQVLEICQDVAGIAQQWNSSFCLSVDPAVCIIAFISLVFLDLHLKFAGSGGVTASASLQNEIEHCEAVLLLFLEQFAKPWTLPRLLVLSFKGFRESLRSPISSQQVRAVLVHLESPLHPRWLQFLQSADEILESFSWD